LETPRSELFRQANGIFHSTSHGRPGTREPSTMSLQLKRIACHSFKPSAAPCKGKVPFAKPTSRLLSESARHQTRQRKSMWIWMSTQGRNFRDPLPGSTNYLGAYNSNGELLRSRGGATENNRDDSSGGTSSRGNKPLPREHVNDLIPFPQNRAFRSERVVSEAMREDIWGKVMKDGQSVRAVSAQLGVEMNRVGAIVRLKEVEKEWVRRVSFSNSFSLGSEDPNMI
jgi:hypothetical protein